MRSLERHKVALSLPLPWISETPGTGQILGAWSRLVKSCALTVFPSTKCASATTSNADLEEVPATHFTFEMP